MGHNQPSEVDNDQLRAIVELDTLVTRWEAAEELNVHHSSYLKQTGKVKKFDKWVPHEVKVKVIQPCPISCHPIDYTVHGILQARILEWLAVPFSRESFQPRDQTQVSYIAGRFFISWATREVPKLTTYQKYCHFEESSSLILLNNNESFFDWIVTCDKKWIAYNWWWPAQWPDWEVLKHFPKPACTKERAMVTIWWSAAGLIHYSFLNPGKIIIYEKYSQQINEMHWKLQHLQSALVKRKGPILCDNAWLHIAQTKLQKLNEQGYKILPHWPYSRDLLPTDYHFFKHLDNFLQGKCYQ